MPTLADALEGINDIRQKMTDEQDEKGLSPLYIKGNRFILEWLETQGFTVSDHEELDGYFIFGTGTGSVLHFHITEIPGFKFGLWWNGEKSEHGLGAEIFAQYEAEIDKFKPSRSNFCENIMIYDSDYTKYDEEYYDRDEWAHYNLYNMLCFMRDYPALAWMYDFHNKGGAYEYVSNSRAKHEYRMYKMRVWFDERVMKWAEKKAYKMIPRCIRKHPGFKYLDTIFSMPTKQLVIIPTAEEEVEDGDVYIFTTDEENRKFEKRCRDFSFRVCKLLRYRYWSFPYHNEIRIVNKKAE